MNIEITPLEIRLLKRFVAIYSDKKISKTKLRLFIETFQSAISKGDIGKKNILSFILEEVQLLTIAHLNNTPVKSEAKTLVSSIKKATTAKKVITKKATPSKKVATKKATPAKKVTAKKVADTLSTTSILPSSELMNKKYDVYDMGHYSSVFGAISLPIIAMNSGLPGGGKTSFLLSVGGYFSHRGKNVLFVSNEEGAGATLQAKLKRFDHAPKHLFVTNNLPKTWKKFDVVILDSVSSLNLTPDDFESMIKTAKANDISLLAVFQANKSGNYRGFSQFEHDVDISLTTNNGIVSVKKNRFGVLGAGTYKIY